MIVLIPLGGLGQRFKVDGYCNPKPLINVMGKPIIHWLLDGLVSSECIGSVSLVYIPYAPELANYGFESKIQRAYPKIKFKFLNLRRETLGAAETIRIALDALEGQEADAPILCVDGDNHYEGFDLLKAWSRSNEIVAFKDSGSTSNYSFLSLKDDGKVQRIVEKERISDLACCGVYGFGSWQELRRCCAHIIEQGIMDRNEYYTSTVIRIMLEQGSVFSACQIEQSCFKCLGTPNDVQAFRKEFSYLLDLDGTLVVTDSIYVQVWNELLQPFHLEVDESFFTTFIMGRTDAEFLKDLVPGIRRSEIDDISRRKDDVFMGCLDKVDPESILIPGAYQFVESLRDNKVAVVTNSNRSACEHILKRTGLDAFVQVVVASGDCLEGKPSPIPYNYAAQLLGATKNKCIAMEDSWPGYLSAKAAKLHRVFIMINKNSCDQVKATDETKITNFHGFDPGMSFTEKDHRTEMLCEALEHLGVQSIEPSATQLKTGYICSIRVYTLTTLDSRKHSIVVKTSNFGTPLSSTAESLDMYNREALFYSKHSNIVGRALNVADFYAVVREGSEVGIVLEDLTVTPGTIGLDLNNKTDLLVRVVSDVARMHNMCYFASEEDVLRSMKDLMKVNGITEYLTMVQTRFDLFFQRVRNLVTEKQAETLKRIGSNFGVIMEKLSMFPLSFCHGDLKSANIYYQNNVKPFYLDWQYIHLGKGVSDIVFLLVESIKFDKLLIGLVLDLYYRLSIDNNKHYTYEQYKFDVKCSLCCFPFFVCVWFNSEDASLLLDKSFPVKFLRRTLKYYDHFLDDDFFDSLLKAS
uniref:Nucleotidyl transferase domain-containing protein n=1 Tax=Hemiselmis andersenii TaxID=464988 RepID=A0A6U2H9V3_HEMAN|mmetsp:Transcript_40374/g.94517  ORF Transcript_40374/g.94517 Transcript_40374/m.94517 type:complete len:807 (-) Transcript_40374:264-2684(-)